MLKDLFSNRFLIGALAFFVLIVVSGTLYLRHVEQQSARELAETNERIKALTENPPATVQAPVEDTSQGGHFHADGTWHEGPQDVSPLHPEISGGELPRKPGFIRTEDWEALSDDEKSRIRVIHGWASWTDEERTQRDKEQTQLYIDEIANEPVFAEVYTLMTENEYPYSLEVQDKLSQAQMRVTHELMAQAKVAAERRKKSLSEFYELEREIAIKEAQGR